MPRVEEVQLGFDSLAELDDGRAQKVFLRHIAIVAADCINRPGDTTARKVSLDFNITPILEEDGSCETVKVEIEAKSKVPTFRTKKYEMRVSKGGLLFNRDFPDALDQQPLFDGDSKE